VDHLKKLKILFLIFSISFLNLFLINNAKASISSSNRQYYDENNVVLHQNLNGIDTRYLEAVYSKENNELYLYHVYSNDSASGSWFYRYSNFSSYPYVYLTFGVPGAGYSGPQRRTEK